MQYLRRDRRAGVRHLFIMHEDLAGFPYKSETLIDVLSENDALIMEKYIIKQSFYSETGIKR